MTLITLFPKNELYFMHYNLKYNNMSSIYVIPVGIYVISGGTELKPRVIIINYTTDFDLMRAHYYGFAETYNLSFAPAPEEMKTEEQLQEYMKQIHEYMKQTYVQVGKNRFICPITRASDIIEAFNEWKMKMKMK